MLAKVGINGFGRIGRLILRGMVEQDLLGKAFDVVAVADVSTDADYFKYLLTYDSTQRRWDRDVTTEKSSPDLDHNDTLVIDGKHKVRLIQAQRSPADLPWKELGVEYVLECTGIFKEYEKAIGHIQAGAKKVVLSQPGKGDIKTFVMGVNNKEYDPDKHLIISNASCTTNCLAPVVHVLLENGLEIEKGLMTTIHAYTSTQKTVDGISAKNWRLGRAAGVNIIPTTTGAAKAVGEVIPAVNGILTGMAFRVPVATGSVVDLTVLLKKDSSIEEIDAMMKRASETYLKGILKYCDEPIVSSDITHESRSSVYDSRATLDNNLKGEKRFFKLISWYDNEWGYSMRTIDMLHYIIKADAASGK